MNLKLIDAYIYHHGWVSEPTALHQKRISNIRLYKEYLVDKEKADTTTIYEHDKAEELVVRFNGIHCFNEGSDGQNNWPFNPNPSLKNASAKDKFKCIIAKWNGWFPGKYKNYKIVK